MVFRVAGPVASIAPAFVAGYYGAFHYDYTTALTANVTNTATTLNVTSTTGFSNTGSVIIQSEIIQYTGITATSFTGCTRGSYGSNQSTHASGTPVGSAQGSTANVATLLLMNTTDYTSGVSLTASSELLFAHAGVYNIQFSAQLFNSGNAPDNFTIWLKKNGTDIPATASIATTPEVHGGIPGAGIVAANFYVDVLVNDKIQFYWSSDSSYTVIATYPSDGLPVHPASPGFVATVTQVA